MTRTIEPYQLLNGQEGWYVHCFDLGPDAPRSFRLDRIREARITDDAFEPRPDVQPDVRGWPKTGEVPGVTAGPRLDGARARPLGPRGPPRGRRS